jgi:hypothetical protein
MVAGGMEIFGEIDQIDLHGFTIAPGDCAKVQLERSILYGRIVNIVRERASKYIYLVMNLYVPKVEGLTLGQDPAHLIATEKLFIVPATAFLSKIYILHWKDYISGLKPVDVEVAGGLFYFGLLEGSSRLWRVSEEALDWLIPSDFIAGLMKVVDVESVPIAFDALPVPVIPSEYRMHCPKCEYSSVEGISSVAFHFLGHFAFNGDKITEQVQKAHCASSHSLCASNANLSREKDKLIPPKVVQLFERDFAGNILWYSAPPIFVRKRRGELMHSLTYQLHKKDKSRVEVAKTKCTRIHSSNKKAAVVPNEQEMTAFFKRITSGGSI